MSLIRISPSDLKGPRAYFTDWNKRSSSSNMNDEQFKHTVFRKLKALILTKRNVVFAASDLNSSIAFQILNQNPELLDKGILLPALRSDRGSLEDVSSDPAVRSFVLDRSVTAVSWSLEENVDWFRSRFVEELSVSNSVIRTRLIELCPSFDHSSLVVALSVNGQSIQDVVDQHANFLPAVAKTMLLNYRGLLYHMSGARVVHSESFLPQENLVDCDVLADGIRDRLSEETIFFKVFVEQALRTLGRKQIPIEVLDQLTIPELLTLRSVYESSGFIEHYDKMVESMLKAAVSNDPRTAILHLKQLEDARDFLFENFTRHFETELARFKKVKKISAFNAVVSPTTSVALGAAGLALGGVPGLFSGASATGALIASLLSLSRRTQNLHVAHTPQ